MARPASPSRAPVQMPRASDSRGTDATTRLITKVARMYHERGIRQVDIAASLSISQAKVSRLLKQAAERGIVRTIVEVAGDVHPDLEEQLEHRYHLLEAMVVDIEGDEADILAALGSAAAGYLESTLTGSERIGISSWSESLLAMVDRLRPFRAPGAQQVVQLLGGVGAPRVQALAARLVGDLAHRLNASPIMLQAPALVASREIRDSLLADPSLATVLQQWEELTLALVGIGTVRPSPLLAESGNAMPVSDQEALRAVGAIGDVCFHFFDAAGTLVDGDLESRVVGVPTTVFRRIPRRIGVAGGPRKLEAIRAALTGGWVNVIMTDLATARALVA